MRSVQGGRTGAEYGLTGRQASQTALQPRSVCYGYLGWRSRVYSVHVCVRTRIYMGTGMIVLVMDCCFLPAAFLTLLERAGHQCPHLGRAAGSGLDGVTDGV